jgi:hypothetical protein
MPTHAQTAGGAAAGAHALELAGVFGRTRIDESALRQLMTNVRRARDQAEVRGGQARTLALRAGERAAQLHLGGGGL